MVKQYVVHNAYAGNDAIDIYEDGIKVRHKVVAYYETQGFCNALEMDGYTRAYDLDELKKNVENTREEYELALKIYEDAIPFALVKPY